MSSTRKQTIQRVNRPKQLNAARYKAPQSRVMSPTNRARTRPLPGWLRALILSIVLLFLLAADALLLHDQVQIGRVLVSGMPAEGRVMALEPCVSRAGGGYETILFTDAHGEPHRVRHVNFIYIVCTTYHLGENLPIRYVPSDPSDLMTQPETDNLWFSLILFTLGDVIFGFGGVAFVYVNLHPTVARLVAALRARRHV
jgi:hypothetical protein